MSSGALMLARASGLLSTLILLPLLLAYLDHERFGLWMTFSSIAALMTLTDFGLGNGLMTNVAVLSADGCSNALKCLISSGFAAMTVLSIPVTLLIIILTLFAPLDVWLGTTTVPMSELRSAVIILCAGLIFGGITGIASRVQTGLQTGYIASVWATITSLATFISLLVAIHFQIPFRGLVAVFVSVPLITGFANTLWYFSRNSSDFRPVFDAVDQVQVTALFRTGCFFFLLQVAAAITFATDNLIIASVSGVSAVPAYAIPARLFGLISLTVAIVVQPLWPAYAEASARGDILWIRKAFYRSLWMALTFSLICASSLYMLRNFLFPLWTKGQIQVNPNVVAALATWCVVESCGIALAMLLNGLKIVRFQLIIAFTHTVLSIPLRYYFLAKFGLWGLPIATTLVYLTTAVLPCAIAIPRFLGTNNRLSSQHHTDSDGQVPRYSTL